MEKRKNLEEDMFLEKLRLQLFAESEENQEVAEPETDVISTEDNQITSEEVTEVAGQSTDVNNVQTEPIKEQTQQRDYEKDAAFAKIRREAELAKKQNEMLARTLKQYGFEGDTPEEIIDNANAHYLNRPVEEIRQRRVEAEKRQQEEAQKEAELEFYRKREIERLMQDDLQKIQKLDPTVKSLDELGDEFFNLKKAGVDAELAFSVIQQKKQKETKIPPAEVGKVNSNSNAEKDYYSPTEVDRLTKKELADPKIMARVMESMTKWK